ncbi:17283_t:CDS:2 [Cetraspora pellucida]|uniref:17283_t:CDS:1 n=1 Tax=Cetraspora pellucida TaxID=1433469 RepID=A0A9N9B780_9GLOM|nr:17283_t:CDS:2 [Cetraspora pellucida]
MEYTTQLNKTDNIKLNKHTECLQLLGPEQKKHLDKIIKKDKTATSKKLTEVVNNTYSELNIALRTVCKNF